MPFERRVRLLDAPITHAVVGLQKPSQLGIRIGNLLALFSEVTD
jgi:hypothetical protein